MSGLKKVCLCPSLVKNIPTDWKSQLKLENYSSVFDISANINRTELHFSSLNWIVPDVNSPFIQALIVAKSFDNLAFY